MPLTFKQLHPDRRHPVLALCCLLDPAPESLMPNAITAINITTPNARMLSTLSSRLCSLISLFLLSIISVSPLSAVGQTPSTTTPLPELGSAQNASANTNAPIQLNVNGNGISLNGQLDPDTRFTLRPEYSNQTGVAINAGIATLLTERAALGFLLTAGSNKTEIIANAGWQIDARQDLVLSFGQLQQRLDYQFLSGTEKARMTQRGGGLSYQYQFARFAPQAKNNPLLQTLEFNLYHTNTPSRELGNRLYSIDTANRFELWNDPRRIAGGQISGGQASLGLTPFSGSLIKLALGTERLRYDLKAGKDSTDRLTSGITWQQHLSPATQALLSAERNASQDRYRLGWQHRLASVGGQHQIGMELMRIEGRDNLGNDTQVQLNYTYHFDLGNRNTQSNRTSQATPIALHATPGTQPLTETRPDNLRDQRLNRVAQRPTYLPSHVVAKVDTTAPERLIAINKTGLPPGSQINTANGDIIVPINANIQNIGQITRNGALFTNAGQYLLNGNLLTVRPSKMSQPTAPTDTYIITLNNVGGGHTIVTVVTSKGSVQIDSIHIQYDTTAPQILDSSISLITQTSAQFNVTLNKNGTVAYLLKPSTDPTPSLADVQNGVSFALTVNQPATQALTGLIAGTSYKLYFTAKDNAGNWQPTASTLTFNTTAAPQPLATTLGALTQGAYFHTASATVTSDKAGTGHYILQESAQPAPSIGTVLASSQTVSLSNGGTSTLNFTDLKHSAAYTLYFAATDGTTPQTVVSQTSLTTGNLPVGYVDYGGLIWRPIDSTNKNWNAANTYCTTSTINGQTGWRLPTEAELQDIAQNNLSGMNAAGWTLFLTWSSTGDGMGGHMGVDLLTNGLSVPYNNLSILAVSCVR